MPLDSIALVRQVTDEDLSEEEEASLVAGGYEF